MKYRGYLLAGFGLILVVLTLELSAPRQAVGQQTGGLPALEQRVAALEAKLKSLDFDALKSDVASLKTTVSNLQTTVSSLQATVNDQATQITALQSALAQEVSDRKAAVGPLADLLQPFSRNGTELYLTGANLHIINGMSSTNTTNGLGNLIVGYNESRVFSGGKDVRTGSHNIIVGDQNNYSSFGGMVVGLNNTISGDYASVSGGFTNTASKFGSSVSGGFTNTASGSLSSVSGGWSNTASGGPASVSGGFSNKASGGTASVSGGLNVTQDAGFGWSAGSLSANDISGNFRSP